MTTESNVRQAMMRVARDVDGARVTEDRSGGILVELSSGLNLVAVYSATRGGWRCPAYPEFNGGHPMSLAQLVTLLRALDKLFLYAGPVD